MCRILDIGKIEVLKFVNVLHPEIIDIDSSNMMYQVLPDISIREIICRILHLGNGLRIDFRHLPIGRIQQVHGFGNKLQILIDIRKRLILNHIRRNIIIIRLIGSI